MERYSPLLVGRLCSCLNKASWFFDKISMISGGLFGLATKTCFKEKNYPNRMARNNQMIPSDKYMNPIESTDCIAYILNINQSAAPLQASQNGKRNALRN